ncbi:ABC transporter ATP-binding protein [Paraburkholderia sp. 22099]|jgi:lipopolysaccharide transport system ATP-binding protein|uniref:Lipopolysaccharide transport system ATP-binding protein n=1 Tax=Paraburkholderia terricola TaxID=169427 RepID=A0ABU1LLX8_9BURK|nr:MULTISPECIES: ABC transporter ATP-binding protein [Paraburkholderia]ORC46625.1 sugar ABC transporter ATP-binding protein [Burkholderia sp. A27]AXE91498.1 sugar ABC transporter ATP-binding protein [Paraburkholderia terricola]MDR6407570.1 lipopolysaccharide transport system ATP-binding protein [Paraburkholderia terricola]MDR6445013.1 lipopolysaccharide transport system ATP-binding protein [Paraburkholderia terricola]MDR6480215.1 lipopolysaccharide transport system ATP-binding protein [Parabur
MTESYIRATNLLVEFPIYNASHRSLRKSLLSATTGGRVASDAGRRVTVRALDDVSFELRPGDRVGLVGHNGAGKTTMLRVLAGVYPPVSGRLVVKGSIVSLIDMSLGMEPEATGYENIFLRGIIMGLRPAEIEEKLDEIAAFSELGEDFLNMPVRTYSSGMMLRLAFAVSTAVKSDIVLMDEWLSVGDASFNDKAAKRLTQVVEESAILVLASHSPDMVKRMCNRVFSFEHGKITEISV